jgi:transcriptional repressor NrdR
VRRRECSACKYRFSTTEVVGLRTADLPLLQPMVEKKDGTLEVFNKKKLHNSIAMAVRKPKRDDLPIDNFIQQIEASIGENVSSTELGTQVLEWLCEHDDMGYLRYASVHEELNSPADFIALIKRLGEASGE